MKNNEIASRLNEHARFLRKEKNNLHRAKAYRYAAGVLTLLEEPIEELLKNRGRRGLEELPGIGRRLARTIADYLETGEWHTRN